MLWEESQGKGLQRGDRHKGMGWCQLNSSQCQRVVQEDAAGEGLWRLLEKIEQENIGDSDPFLLLKPGIIKKLIGRKVKVSRSF